MKITPVRVYFGGKTQKDYAAEAPKKLSNDKAMLKKLENSGVIILDPETTFVSKDTEIGRDTLLYPYTFISGKTKIGEACAIGPFAHIRDNTRIADNVRVGNFVEVINSDIGSKTNALHLSYIGNSDIGEKVNIGAGSIMANFDSRTGQKSTTTVKDGVSVGANSVLVAPVTMGENSMTGAGTVVTKDVPANMLVYRNVPLTVKTKNTV